MTTLMERVETKTIRAAVVEDDLLVRQGIINLLNQDPAITIVGEAGTVQEAINLIRETQPDVAVLDIRLRDGTGIDVGRAMRTMAPQTKIIVLSAFVADEYVSRLASLGVTSYLTKTSANLQLTKAVHDAADGWLTFAPPVAHKVLDILTKTDHREGKRPVPERNLTAREKEILKYVARGFRNVDIAKTLGISPKTVEAHLESALLKLGAKNRIEAVLATIQRSGSEEGNGWDEQV